MSTKLTKFKHATLFLVGISAASIPAMARADWWMAGLGGIGGSSSYATGINDSGQVVGRAQTANRDFQAFITGPNGTGMTSLGEFTSNAFAINDSGEVVGRDIFGHAFLYSHGVMTDLSLLDPFVTGGWRTSTMGTGRELII